MDPNPTPLPDHLADAPSQSGPKPDPAPEQAPVEPPAATAQPLPADLPQLDANKTDEADRPRDPSPVAHITRSPSPVTDPVSDPMDKDPVREAEERTPSSEASAEAPHSPDPSALAPERVSPSAAPTSASPTPVPAQQAPAVPPVFTTHLPLTMVQTGAGEGQPLTARQLGQRARRARERELQAQGLYTPKRRTSSTATMPDPPVHTAPPPADVTMQSADEGGDDDGEGELESEVNGSTTPSVPPHSASHLIPPIAVLAPVTTPSRASLAQRARRERERATRLGISPNASPNGTSESQLASSSQPIPFNPTAQAQSPTLTRGQLAQRARRARERVERAAKAANGQPSGENWTQSLNSSDGSGGMSSAGEAVFAVAPPPPGFSPTQLAHSSLHAGYGVGLGAAHVPQQLNRAQLAQRARRARERQQRLAAAATHASGVHHTSTSAVNDRSARSDSGSIPPTSPTTSRHALNDSPARTSLSPMTSSTTDTPAPLNIGAQFDQVFKSLTAGDNGVSRAVAGSGAGILTSGGRTSSPAERATSIPSVPPPKSELTKAEEPMEIDTADDNADQLSEEPAPAPATPAPATPAPTTLRPPTPPIQTVSSPKPQPEVHRSAVQSVGA
ncbi:unnamed protein product [Rhizoctonia solani]|uniref:Uncharacterized protein n=1 Tax=Rhizoctonia solani TaxID=456999 RepID=A0A8H3CXA4_9AGAM|nr:unnamed protein product [Rhizoctonia solani]